MAKMTFTLCGLPSDFPFCRSKAATGRAGVQHYQGQGLERDGHELGNASRAAKAHGGVQFASPSLLAIGTSRPNAD